jgi:hypothetical protein
VRLAFTKLPLGQAVKNAKKEIKALKGISPLALSEGLDNIPESYFLFNLSLPLRFERDTVIVTSNTKDGLLVFGSYGYIYLQYITKIEAIRNSYQLILTYGDRPFLFSTGQDLYEPFLYGLISYIKSLKEKSNTYEMITKKWTEHTDMDQPAAESFIKRLFPKYRDSFIEDCSFSHLFKEMANNNKITKDSFVNIYRRIRHISMPDEIFKKYSENGTMTEAHFKTFLESEQNEKNTSDKFIKKIMSHILRNQKEQNYFTEDTFAEYLSSEFNDAFDRRSCGYVYQDMNKPLTHYYIASSHNTYCDGHQITGTASVLIYSKVLLSGCRCIEIDTWNGPDGHPIVLHGKTPMNPIKFEDVVKCVRDNAFVTSVYPVIISLENHCDEDQRIVMARFYKEILGDMLLHHSDINPPSLPSPSQLKRKIIIKSHAKGPAEFDDIIYLRSKRPPTPPKEMYSSSEDGVNSLDLKDTIETTKNQFIRIYPAGTRIDSSNYYPMRAWSMGIQLVALNYQTHDDAQLINLAKFKDNGGCGYIMKPRHFLENIPTSVHHHNSSILLIQLIEARLSGNRSPIVSVKITRDSSLEPVTIYGPIRKHHEYYRVVWGCEEPLVIPYEDGCVVLITFEFRSKKTPAVPTLLHCAYPVHCLRTGYRIFPLKKGFRQKPGNFLLARITERISFN